VKDDSFTLEPGAAACAPPFSYQLADQPWPAPSWSIRDGRDAPIGHARTRAGARRAVRDLYRLPLAALTGS
jgi:hypothetical protein